jgi:hypothetical protein
MRARLALWALGRATDRLHAAQEVQRDAMRTASDSGASLREIAGEAGLSHEQVRRIVRDRPRIGAYFVTVERRGVSPIRAQLLVRATSREAAGELAAWIAQRDRGGMFEATKVRRAAKDESAYPVLAYDDAL